MDKIFQDYKDVHVTAVKVYVNDSKAYEDSAFTTQLTTSELKEAFVKGLLIVEGDDTFAKPVRYSVADSVGSISYIASNGSVATAAAVADPE